MDWNANGDADRVLTWLRANGLLRYVPSKKLDWFATSMRDFDDVSANLTEISTSGTLSVSDPSQRLGDLRRTALVQSADLLTPFGQRVLDSWSSYGVANGHKGDEFARHLALAIEARNSDEAAYREFFAYWAQLRSEFDAFELIDSWDALYTLNYLDVEIDGFAPGRRYRIENTPVSDIQFDLDEFAASMGDPIARRAAIRIANAINGQLPRGRHRATFCAAMEIVLSEGDATEIILGNFGYPMRPRQWDAFSQEQAEKVRGIANDLSFVAVAGEATSIEDAQEASSSPGAKSKVVYELPATVDFSKVKVQISAKPKPQLSMKANVSSGKKTDYISKAIDNSAIGKLGEQFALKYEAWRLRNHPDLLKRLVHVADTDDSVGYDIHSFELDGTDRFVEVKSTNGPVDSRFFISANELSVSKAKAEKYVLLRVGRLTKAPVCAEFRHPFEELELVPVVYEVTIRNAD